MALPEPAIRDEMVRLLEYANRGKVGKALGVSRQSVNDWAAGRSVTEARLDQVRRLIYGRQTQNEPAPHWAGRALAILELLAEERGISDEAIDAQIRKRVEAQWADQNEPAQTPTPLPRAGNGESR